MGAGAPAAPSAVPRRETAGGGSLLECWAKRHRRLVAVAPRHSARAGARARGGPFPIVRAGGREVVRLRASAALLWEWAHAVVVWERARDGDVCAIIALRKGGIGGARGRTLRGVVGVWRIGRAVVAGRVLWHLRSCARALTVVAVVPAHVRVNAEPPCTSREGTLESCNNPSACALRQRIPQLTHAAPRCESSCVSPSYSDG